MRFPQTTSLSVKEDKRMMEDIKRLAANKPMIRQYDEAQESLKGVRDHHSQILTNDERKKVAEWIIACAKGHKPKNRHEPAASPHAHTRTQDTPSCARESVCIKASRRIDNAMRKGLPT